MGDRIVFYLPKDLRGIIKETFVKGKCNNVFDNLSLVIMKYCPFSEKDGKREKPKYDKFGYEIKLPENALNKYNVFCKCQIDLWNSLSAEILKLTTKSRLVVGLGDESVYETSIRLHRNYGVPYIPGSALKGVTKHYAILELTEKLKDIKEFKDVDFFNLAKKVQDALENPAKDENSEEDVKKAIKEKLGGVSERTPDAVFWEMQILRKMFGTQNQEGSIIFFDAFPNPKSIKDKPILELDIMSPHYQPYYREGKEPGDWYDPKPIFFLAVPRGIEFHFALAYREMSREQLEKAQNQKLLENARALLCEALKEHGVGAKTALGYGRMIDE